jgi:O-methyltransferase
MSLRAIIYRILRRLDIEVTRNASKKFPVELSDLELRILSKAKPITMTSVGRLSGIAIAMRYLRANQIEGDVVECGVWAGGSIAAAALLGSEDFSQRKYWLFDTFEGMTRPSVHDPKEAKDKYLKTKHQTGEGSNWCEVNETQVRNNLIDVGVDISTCVFIAGDVANTLIQKNLPTKIALLRLDTDWYESTLIELEQLFPKLVPGGVLIIDDYGHWEGARKAVDEYFERQKIKPFLIPLDYTGRICIKA